MAFQLLLHNYYWGLIGTIPVNIIVAKLLMFAQNWQVYVICNPLSFGSAKSHNLIVTSTLRMWVSVGFQV